MPKVAGLRAAGVKKPAPAPAGGIGTKAMAAFSTMPNPWSAQDPNAMERQAMALPATVMAAALPFPLNLFPMALGLVPGGRRQTQVRPSISSFFRHASQPGSQEETYGEIRGQPLRRVEEDEVMAPGPGFAEGFGDTRYGPVNTVYLNPTEQETSYFPTEVPLHAMGTTDRPYFRLPSVGPGGEGAPAFRTFLPELPANTQFPGGAEAFRTNDFAILRQAAAASRGRAPFGGYGSGRANPYYGPSSVREAFELLTQNIKNLLEGGSPEKLLAQQRWADVPMNQRYLYNNPSGYPDFIQTKWSGESLT